MIPHSIQTTRHVSACVDYVISVSHIEHESRVESRGEQSVREVGF